jgi:hypothetical protein
MSVAIDLDEMEARIRAMTPEKREALRRTVQPMLVRPWFPQPGPQADAYYHEADETLYGGAAGGGKTDLLLGLATTAHDRTVIFRRQSVDLATIWNRFQTIVAGRVLKQNESTKKARLSDGRFIEFGHLEKPGSEKGWQGNAHDLYGFDEAAQLDPNKVMFVTQWLRSANPGQRCRIVFATNPPIPEYDEAGNLVDTGTGAWLKEWFAPWLDELFHDPAKPGELRWCYMRAEGDRIATVWVDGPGAFDPETGVRVENYTQDHVDTGKVSISRSRTFIKALLKDNAYYRGTGYAARLSSTPEPLKSLLLNGSFSVRGEDHPMQVIPTMWALKAQERYREAVAEDLPRRLRQLVLSGDIAQGGVDTTVLASWLEQEFLEEPLAQAGRETPTGFEVEQLVLGRRRDGSLVVLDGTGGWGGSTRDLLWDHQRIEAEMFIASEKSTGWTEDGRWKFGNMRTEMWWNFRVCLDPKSTHRIKLPLSSRLFAQLTTPHFRVDGKTLWIESKDDIRKRLSGASTDEADAVLQGWVYYEQALAQLFTPRPDIVDRIVRGMSPAQLREEQAQPLPMDDPLRGFR